MPRSRPDSDHSGSGRRWRSRRDAYSKQTLLIHLDQRPISKLDIALRPFQASLPAARSLPLVRLDGPDDWVAERPELRRLYEQALRTIDPGKQEDVLRQMDRHSHEQAYLLFLYNPIQLYAVNRAVQFVPYATARTRLADTSLTDQHWSLRKGNSKK